MLSEGGARWLAVGGVLAATATTVSAVAPNRRRAATMLPNGDESHTLLETVCRNEFENLSALKSAQSL